MTRFVLGFCAGAVAMALVQFVYSPLESGSIERVTLEEPPAIDEPPRSPNVDTAPTTEGSERSNNRAAAPRSSAPSRAAVDDAAAERSGAAILRIELPNTHAGFVDRSRPSLPEEHALMEREAVDAGWAELVEAQIYRHVTEHPRGADIAIVSLNCRTTRCEIAGTVYAPERGGDVWQEVLADMRQQAWFANNFADSALGAGGAMPGEHRFVTMLARTGTEIAPPVDP